MADGDVLAPDEADRRRLIERLAQMGATPEELEDADRAGALGPLALELALRGPGEPLPFEKAVQDAGLETDQAVRVWRALGFPDPLVTPLRLAPRQVEALRVLVGSGALFGEDTGLQLARVVGGSMSRLAEALVDAFRIRVEVPSRESGEPDSTVVADYAETAATAFPPFAAALGDILAGHMVAVSRASWGLDEERAAVTRDLVVGFADLVGYTATARRLSPAELAAEIGGFQDRAEEIVGSHGGRVVKLIGDEVMFAVEEPAAATGIALELMDALSADPRLPRLRIGIASGPVVSYHGDYYGDVVNLAARLVQIAEPGAVLVTHGVAEKAGAAEGAEAVELPPLKGYDTPIAACRLALR